MKPDPNEFLGAAFFKASASAGNGACVETAFINDHIAVRDSKDQHGPLLVFTKQEWDAFQDGVRKGEFEFDLGRQQQGS